MQIHKTDIECAVIRARHRDRSGEREKEREGQRPNFFKQNEGEPVFSLNLPDKREGEEKLSSVQFDVGKKEIRVIRKFVDRGSIELPAKQWV